MKQKLKTKKAAAKRFKITGSGKIMRKQTGQAHLNAKQSGNKRRQKRKLVQVTGAAAKKIKKLLPYH